MEILRWAETQREERTSNTCSSSVVLSLLQMCLYILLEDCGFFITVKCNHAQNITNS